MEHNEKLGPLQIDEIRNYLPHRYPFLLVDRVLEIHPVGAIGGGWNDPIDNTGSTVVATKNVSVNEPFFQGHFPEFPIMPGVLLIEMMAQVSCFTLYPWANRDLAKFVEHYICVLVGVDSARFRKPVVPGDSLRVEAKCTRVRGRLFFFDAVATVDGQKVCEASLLASLNPNGKGATP